MVAGGPKVAFVGSSSLEPGSPLPRALAEQLLLEPGQWVALGVRGSRLARWSRRPLPRELPRGLAAIVVLLAANDPRPSAAAIREVDAALRAQASSDAPTLDAPTLVWLPPPPYPAGSPVHGRDARMRAALAGAAAQDREFLWVRRLPQLEAAHFAPDGVHPTLAGYRSYARQLAPELGALLDRALGRIGYLRVAGAAGLRLPLRGLDAVWLARASVGEGGTETDAVAIASTMLRRWALLRSARPSSPFRSLSDLVVGRFEGADPYEGEDRAVAVRGYSQPVAVQWRAQGDAARRARRRRVRSLRWEAIAPWRREAVLQVLSGSRPLTAAPAVHFAAPSVVAARLAEHAGWREVAVLGAHNAFVSTTASRQAPEPVVRAAGSSPRGSGGGTGPVLGALGLLAGAALLARQLVRRAEDVDFR